MAKLFNILAASVGGGLVLGAIRLCESLGSKSPTRVVRDREDPTRRTHAVPRQASFNDSIAARLDRVEEMLREAAIQDSPTMQRVYPEVVRDLSADLPAVGTGEPGIVTASIPMADDLDRRLTEVEEKLIAGAPTADDAMGEVHSNSVDAHVEALINRLESDAAIDSVRLSESRECSLQGDSVQNVLVMLDRLAEPADCGRAGLSEFAERTAPSDSTELAVFAGH